MNKCLFLISLILSSWGNLIFASSGAQPQVQVGAVIAVDVQSRTIQIDQVIYGLSDGMIIYSPNGNLLNQGVLAAGQQIQFSLGANAPGNAKAPTPITQIKILAGFNDNTVKK